ncbi:DUF4139 domain-containing protein [Parendozoicomonas haliclonae]|uniref:DUF4139 domain-containing protein n=1 Tax=Parendozoicomonas haliclonae TaxID=1960125 RepID=A0A1X7AJY6_9GAMM|nr:DUF4139 domain-containing protein [Parendozoicomonas haliclonae]SMA47222.1 hypothetical protein EHSB41UT_02345 [Parendozoicomonas haliclonae]
MIKASSSRALFPAVLSAALGSSLLCTPLWADDVPVFEVKADQLKSTALTLYNGNGLVNQTIEQTLSEGNSELRLKPDFSFWDLATLHLSTQGNSQPVLPELLTWNTPLQETADLIGALVGQEVELVRAGRESSIRGKLQAWNGVTGLLQLANQQQELFQWQEGFSLRSLNKNPLKPAVLSPRIQAHFNLKQPASAVELSYFNRGLSYSNLYRIVMDPEAGKLDLGLTATVRNQSITPYRQAKLALASGDSGVTNEPEMFMARKAMAMDSAGIGGGQRAGELLFIPVPGEFDLPARGAVTVPVGSENQIPFSSHYSYDFYGAAHSSGVHKANPVGQIRFTPDKDLPAGPVQLYAVSEQGAQMVHKGLLPQTAGGNPVELILGQAYAVSIERSQMSVRHDRDSWEVDWKLKVSNQFNKAVALDIQDSSSQLISVGKLSGGAKDGLKLSAEIPAATTRIISFTSVYRKN